MNLIPHIREYFHFNFIIIQSYTMLQIQESFESQFIKQQKNNIGLMMPYTWNIKITEQPLQIQYQ
jgi:hypothetical protein